MDICTYISMVVVYNVSEIVKWTCCNRKHTERTTQFQLEHKLYRAALDKKNLQLIERSNLLQHPN